MTTIVIGSGDAGFECVKKLKGTKGGVLWISKERYMTKKWLMSKLVVKSGGINGDKLIVDIPQYIEKNNMNVDFVIDEVKNIDTKKKDVAGKKKTYKYDKLIIATGSVPKMPCVEIADSDKITTFDTYGDFINAREKLKNAKKVAVVGAGPIGFELSLRLASRHEVSLVEHDNDVLMQMLINHPIYRHMVAKMLKLRGVKMHFSTQACSVREGNLLCRTLRGEEFLVGCDVVIFAAGVRQNVPVIDGEDFGRDRVLFCDDFGEAFVHERGGKRKKLNDVYAIGDATCYLTKKNYPASAGFAEKSAKVAAFNATYGNKKRIRYHPNIYYRFVDTILRRIIS